MKKIMYLLMVVALVTSCKKKEVIHIQQQKVSELQTVSDSITVNNFGERKSIHQQEWEEHQEAVVDTLKIHINP
jgi:hypothetical protein